MACHGIGIAATLMAWNVLCFGPHLDAFISKCRGRDREAPRVVPLTSIGDCCPRRNYAPTTELSYLMAWKHCPPFVYTSLSLMLCLVVIRLFWFSFIAFYQLSFTTLILSRVGACWLHKWLTYLVMLSNVNILSMTRARSE